MSEYQDKHTVSSLLGAPPGFVGYDDNNLGGGKLISDLSKNPYTILYEKLKEIYVNYTDDL